MRRWSVFVILILAAIYFFYPKEQRAVPAVVSAPNIKRTPAQQPLVFSMHNRRPVRPPKRAPAQSVLRVDRAKLTVNSGRPSLEQNGRRWRWMSGAVAVFAGDLRVAHLPRLSERPGFWIVASSDLPAGVVGLPLVEREDNGLLGIFTGILKAIGKSGLNDPGQFYSVCPCEIEESYPQLKSYLLRPSQGQEYQELSTCLQGTGLFKRLDWEILDHPRTSR